MRDFSRLTLLLITLSVGGTILAQGSFDTKQMEFVQGGKTYVISGDTSITLEKKPFSFRYYNHAYDGRNSKPYLARITVLEKENDQLSEGRPAYTMPFAPEAGILLSEKDDSALLINEDRHLVLYYATEENRGSYLVETQGDWLKLEWRIHGYLLNWKPARIETLQQKELHFVILIDKNFNNWIDKGELRKIQVNFK